MASKRTVGAVNEAMMPNPVEYKWKIDRKRLQMWENKEIVESPLFGPENVAEIKFKLKLYSFSRSVKQYAIDLILASNIEPSLNLKPTLIVFDTTGREPIYFKNEKFTKLATGHKMTIFNGDFISADSFICEIEINLPEKPEHPSVKLTKDLNSQRLNSRNTDVILVVGKREFSAHKNILSASSSVFEDMFNQEDELNRVIIKDIDEKVFASMLDYIYSEPIKQMDEILPGLLVAADKYKIESLTDECAQSMMESMTKENVDHYLLLADKLSLTDLKDNAIDLINRNAYEVTNSKQFIKQVKPGDLLVHELYLDFVKKVPEIID